MCLESSLLRIFRESHGFTKEGTVLRSGLGVECLNQRFRTGSKNRGIKHGC